MRYVILVTAILAIAGCSKHESPNRTTAATAASGPTASAMAHLPGSIAEWAQGAILFPGLGDFHRAVTTTSSDAQQYFDQGMRFLWAFNHDEATRSFAKAVEIDTKCAMCYWGVALSVGPNYNMPMMAAPRATVAWDALRHAQIESAHATPVEQSLIAALAKRFTGPQPLDPSNSAPVLIAYAAAMRNVASAFPDDLDVQTMYAEAMMNINAWTLWAPDGTPTQGTKDIIATLESVLKRAPMHPGANHYYIHALESSPHPERAMASAERLRTLMPAAGHLVHMPAHIMQRVGRYEDAAEANRVAAAADQAYSAKTTPIDYYPMYTAHNYQFLAFSAAMEGRQAETLDAVLHARAVIPDEMLLAMPGSDWSVAAMYVAMVRFGLWDSILAEAAPNAKLPGLVGGYLYARTVALVARGHVDDAKAALTQLEQLAANTPADYGAGLNTAKSVFAVAIAVAKARIAAAEHRPGDAITLLRDAAAHEDQLAYDEPADWFFPVRHMLGAELLHAGRAPEAETVYRDDLRMHPNNGWALFGLAQALTAQRKTAEAAKVERQFNEAWKYADVKLVASAF